MKELHNFGALVHENKIVIPKIQRDYVQGSNAQQEKRDEFLNVLLEHLSSGTEYHLDFIYGTGGVNQGEFLPLDGQQRLTTIFLIHWVLSQRAGIHNLDVEDYFSYQTRRSSELFCQKLIKERIDFNSFKNGQTISDYVKKETAWYLKQWDTDPTVQAMLEMIDATDSALMNYKGYWPKMCENTLSLLTFDCLNMKDFHLSDSLYVKMNERGKQLTSFENWKARFIKFLADNYSDSEYRFVQPDRSNYAGIKDYFVQSIEHQWSEVVWNYAIEEWRNLDEEKKEDEPYPVIDWYFERYMEYIHELHFYLKNPKIDGEDVKTSDFTNKFSQQCSTYGDNHYLSMLFQSLDVFVNIKKENESIEAFFKSIFYHGEVPQSGKVRLFSEKIPEDIFKYCISNRRENCNVTVQILLYSIIRYCQVNKCYKATPEMVRYVRVMRNLIDGVRQFLTKDLSYNSNIRLNEISNYEKTIGHLCSTPDVDTLLGSCPAGLGNIEHEKAKIELRKNCPDGDFDALEDNSLFHGNLSVVKSIIESQIPYNFLASAVDDFKSLPDIKKVQLLISLGYRGKYIGWSSYGDRYYYGCSEKGWEFVFMHNSGKEIEGAFKGYVKEHAKYNDIQSILNAHANDSEYIRYVLKYDDFLKSARNLFYFASYHYQDDNDLKIISLSRASSKPLSGYNCEPFSDVVVRRLKKADKNIPVSAWGFGSNRGGIHCNSLNLKLKSYTDHWQISVDSPEMDIEGQKSLQQVFEEFGSSYSLSWSEDKSFLTLPLVMNKDLVETAENFLGDLLH